MDLTIDIGNTLCKAGVFDKNGDLVFFEKYETLSLAQLEMLCEKYPITRSIVASVREQNTDIENFLVAKTHHIPFSHASLLPVAIRYETPHTLGLDRIANAVAAHLHYPNENTLSIQAGTCIVYDFIDNQGVYFGGAISPGIDMRFKALHYFTGKLPLVEKKEIIRYVGQNTQQSVKSGVINGLIFEIEGFINQYKTDYPDLKVVMTGGDGDYLRKSIKNVIFAGSNFILKGLHEILKL
ncbi:type III pantothenate kinase, partial [Bacteroidales bacterium OttesenSCG-928-C03]|nr:type III pantothenate kinase [Bacteroidales bacterium OttesenSCG-928-C03]